MRFLSILAMSVFALAATAQSYTITGKIDAKYNGKEIALSEQAVFVDTVVVENGAFKFERNVDDQIVCCVQIPGNRRVRTDIMAAPGAAVTVDFTQNPAQITDNGGFNDKLNEMNSAVAVAGNAVNAKIQELQSKGMPVNEIQAAVGKEGMAPYPVMTPWGVEAKNVKVEIDEALLSEIAESTGGRYFRATDNTKLAEIYAEINKMEKAKTTVDSFPVYKELFGIYALLALLAILLELVLNWFVIRRFV